MTCHVVVGVRPLVYHAVAPSFFTLYVLNLFSRRYGVPACLPRGAR